MKQPENGLTDLMLENTDVMIWWGHMGHQFVADEVVEKVYKRIMNGMGSHCASFPLHYSKFSRKLNGTTCSLKWRDAPTASFQRKAKPTPSQTVFGAFRTRHLKSATAVFDIATPDDVIFEGWYDIGSLPQRLLSPTATARSSISSRATDERFLHNPYVHRIIRTPCIGA